MKTRFSRFLSGKIFPVCFYFTLIIAMFYLTVRTGNVVFRLWGITADGWVACGLVLIFLIHLLLQNKSTFYAPYRFLIRMEGVLVSFLIYFFLSLLCFDLIGCVGALHL